MYIKSLGKSPLTYYELKSIVSSATLEEFEESLSQLVNGGLLLRLVSEQPEVLIHYLAIPPILPILNYYENIDSSLSNIKDLIQELMINSVNQIFQQDDTINLDAIANTFQEFKKDIDAARVLNISDEAFRTSVGRLSGIEVNTIDNGLFRPINISPDIRQAFRENAANIGEADPLASAQSVISAIQNEMR